MSKPQVRQLRNARVITTPRGQVEFDIAGSEGPVVLASHGGGGGVDQGRLFLSHLDASQYRLLSLSRPGYLNTPLESGPSIEDQADLFAALLDCLEIDTTAVITVSAGGPPGYMFAVRHPDRVWALVAIDSVSGYCPLPETTGPLTEAIFNSRIGQQFSQWITRRKPEVILRQLFRTTGYFTKTQIQEQVHSVLTSPEQLTFLYDFLTTTAPYRPRKPGTENDTSLFEHLTRLTLGDIRCPSLIVHGTHAAIVKLYDGVYAYEHIPGAERLWIEEGSHLGFFLGTRAFEAQAAVREFLARARPS